MGVGCLSLEKNNKIRLSSLADVGLLSHRLACRKIWSGGRTGGDRGIVIVLMVDKASGARKKGTREN